MIRNIIFDWSGTLVDDLPVVLEASNSVLAHAGRPPMSLDQFRAEFSLPFNKFYDKHTPDVAFPQLEQWFHAAFREAQGAVTELPHARDFLEFCQAKKFRIFLLSSIHGDHYQAQNRTLKLHPFFEHPYTDVWDKREKIHKILSDHQLRPDETLFIGDMEHDIETARHGGVLDVAVLTGFDPLDKLLAAHPTVVIRDMAALRWII